MELDPVYMMITCRNMEEPISWFRLHCGFVMITCIGRKILALCAWIWHDIQEMGILLFVNGCKAVYDQFIYAWFSCDEYVRFSLTFRTVSSLERFLKDRFLHESLPSHVQLSISTLHISSVGLWLRRPHRVLGRLRCSPGTSRWYDPTEKMCNVLIDSCTNRANV